MIGIALDIGGPAFVAFDQYADGIGSERHRGGVILRLAENQPLRLSYIGDDVFFRSLATAREPGKGERGGHQLQEIATVDRLIPLRSLTRKFAMEQLFELRIVGEFFQSTPILFAGFRFEFFAHSRQIKRMYLHGAVIYAVGVMVMIMSVVMMLIIMFTMMVVFQAVQFHVDVLVLSHTVH